MFRRAVPREGEPGRRTAGVDPLLLPHDAARRPRRAGTTRASRCSSRRGWPAASAARRAATTRWCSARMVRDGARFYDPLGLVSEGTKIDFQTQVNSYLYGTRFMTLAGTDVLAREGGRVGLARRRQPAYYASQFRHVFGSGSRRRVGAAGSPGSGPSSRRTSAAIRKYPVTPSQDISRRGARLGVARLRRSAQRHALRRPQLPRRRGARGRRSPSRPARSGTWSTSRARRSTP